VLVDKRDRLPIALISIHAHDGRQIEWAELQWQDQLDIGQPDKECAGAPDLKLQDVAEG
jgi:hypothetical protein